jgi:hypothetical protein
MDYSIYFVLVRYNQENLDKALPSLNGMQVVDQFQPRKDKYILKYTGQQSLGNQTASDRIVVVFCKTWEQDNIYIVYNDMHKQFRQDNERLIFSVDNNKTTQILAADEKEANEYIEYYLSHLDDSYFPKSKAIEEAFKEAGLQSPSVLIQADLAKRAQSQ